MIIDTLENLSKYVSLNPLFADVVKFIGEYRLAELEEGKHPISGSDAFVNIQVAKGKTKETAVLEYHKGMIDIQVPLSGSETFGYTPVVNLPTVDFNAEKDIAKVPDTPAQTYVTVNPGQMAIFFPQDGHAPCITDDETLLKAIFKVKA
jgi:YhcH/YjgK/YiaL family protein